MSKQEPADDGGKRAKVFPVSAREHEPAIDNGGRMTWKRVPGQRALALIPWAIVVIFLPLIPLKILSYGFIPSGDARRHIAMAFTEASYPDILVMRPQYTMSQSPGWEWVLRFLHQKAGWNADGLVSFSVVSLLLCIFFAPLPWLRRPEAWLAALLAGTVAIPALMGRFAQARPFLVSEGLLIALLFAWARHNPGEPSWLRTVLSCAALSLSVWVHGAWYLWVLLLVAFFLARQWRAGCWLTACWVVGTLAGALLTGHPAGFLKQALWMAIAVYQEHAPEWLLVGEFQPIHGAFNVVVLLVLVFFWRKHEDGGPRDVFRSPILWLIVLSWILGFKADRFWTDWGIPAVLVWLTIQFEDLMTSRWDVMSLKRSALCVLVAIPLFLHSTSDAEGRYTFNLSEVSVDARDPALRGWLPGRHGILYSAQMAFFYDTFFRNPTADWRYILGFEPVLMPEEDLRIYRRIQWTRGALDAYKPWVNKMRPADRLMISSPFQPNLPELEWHYVSGGIWIGRRGAR